MLTSKYGVAHYYLPLGVYSLFYLAPTVLLIWPDLPGVDHGKYANDFGLFFVGLLVIGIAGVIFLLSKAPVITIGPEYLVINYHLARKKRLLPVEIKQLDLITSARPVFLDLYDSSEATIIETIAGEKFTFFAAHYANMPAIRQALSDWAGLAQPTQPEPVPRSGPVEKTAERFAGNFFLVFGGIAFYEILVLLALAFIAIQNIGTFGFITAIAFLWLFSNIFGKQSYYFLISGDRLFIRNYLYPWSEKIVALPAVRDIKFERIPKRSNALRLTTHDFESSLYGAGSLRTKTWNALQERLAEHNIPVRNEAFA